MPRAAITATVPPGSPSEEGAHDARCVHGSEGNELSARPCVVGLPVLAASTSSAGISVSHSLMCATSPNRRTPRIYKFQTAPHQTAVPCVSLSAVPVPRNFAGAVCRAMEFPEPLGSTASQIALRVESEIVPGSDMDIVQSIRLSSSLPIPLRNCVQ